jgi:hypothetical protein
VSLRRNWTGDEIDSGFHWHATASSYLSVRILVTESDQVAALHSLQCHKSQFDPEQMQKLGKAFQAAAKYLCAGIEETGIDDTDFRILEALLNKVPLPVNTIGPKV